MVYGWIAACLLLFFLGLFLAAKPLRSFKTLQYAITFTFTLALFGGYWYWGSADRWYAHHQKTLKEIEAKALLKQYPNIDALINKMRQIVQTRPNSKGWFLLGRLYASKGDWKRASSAFGKAHQLSNEDERITINYLQSMWQQNGQRCNQNIRKQLKKLLKKNPNQADALSMLAIDAHLRQNKQVAILYWKRLLLLLPKDSKDALLIQKAIIQDS